MALYDPNQTLTWKYENSTGKLYIVDSISLQLVASEKVNASKTDVNKGASTVTLTVVSGLNNIPVVQEPYYTNIGTGLNTVANVRARIATLQMVNVTTNVVKNSAVVGTNTSTTNTNTGIVIT